MLEFRSQSRITFFTAEFLKDIEFRCIEFARYANQDIEKVERWPLSDLFRRYRILSKVIEREAPKEI